MIEIRLREEDSFASIQEGGPSCIAGPLNRSPLESLLASDKGYSMMGLEIAKIQMDQEKPFEAPVILLLNRENYQTAVCVRTQNQFGHRIYKLYTYKKENLVQNDSIS